MMPAAFVRLHALPISPNGKLDLKMLAQPTDANLLEGRATKTPARSVEEKLLTMVQELLKTDVVAAEDNFFLAGGHSLLGMQLVISLRRTFGVDLSLRQLFEAPTVKHLALLIESMLKEESPAGSPAVHQRAELAPKKTKGKPVLPDGVLALQPCGTRHNFFWVHHNLSVGLAKLIGGHLPFLSVQLTPEDFSFLGETPTLESFAGCLLRKIQAVQSEGPYTIGGFCLGGLLAYEIASQLRAAGHEVSLVAIVDAPNPSCIESCDSLTSKVNYVRYLLKRATRIGLPTSLAYLRERFIGAERTKSAENPVLQAAALAYRPAKYQGKVLLILASERPPHVNFLPGWQKVVPDGLYTRYVGAHHRDFQKEKVLRSVADVIVSHLPPATHDRPLPFCVDIPESTAPVRTGILTRACA
jgi:thioesterase domain-containing protein/aryl carrier-like protein